MTDATSSRAALAPEPVLYTHQDMIDYKIAHPDCTSEDLAVRYGYTAAWVDNIQSSDAWKAAFAKRQTPRVRRGRRRNLAGGLFNANRIARDCSNIREH